MAALGEPGAACFFVSAAVGPGDVVLADEGKRASGERRTTSGLPAAPSQPQPDRKEQRG